MIGQRNVMRESLIEESKMRSRERIEVDGEIHHRDLGFMQIDEGRIANINYFSNKNDSKEVLVDYSKVKSKVNNTTFVRNVGKDCTVKGDICAISAKNVKNALAARIENLHEKDCQDMSSEVFEGIGSQKISKVGYAMLKGLPDAFEKAIEEETTIDQVVAKLRKASFFEYKPRNEYEPVDHAIYKNWKPSLKTLEDEGFAIKKTIKKKNGVFYCELRLVAPTTDSSGRSLCAGRPYPNRAYASELNNLVIGEIKIDNDTTEKLEKGDIQDIIAKGNPKSFMGHKDIDSSELEAHLTSKEQLDEAGSGLKNVVKRIGKEFKEDMIGSGYNFLKLKGLPLRKKFDMILVGFGKFIPDYLALFRREVPPKSGGGVAIMLIFAVLIGLPFAVINFVFRVVKPIFNPFVYGFFNMLGHPTFSAVPNSTNKGWLKFTGVIKWILIIILAAPVGLIMVAYKLAGCKLSTREVARAAGMDTEGVFTSNDMELNTVNKYKEYPKLIRFLNLYKIIPTIGVGVTIIAFILIFSFNFIVLAIIVVILLTILGTAWYTEIYKKQSKDSNVLFTIADGRICLNSKNRFGAYIFAEMEQILAKNKGVHVTSDEVFKAFLEVVSLNKNPEFVGALNEFLDFYELMLSELNMNDLDFAKKYFGDTITEDGFTDIVKNMTKLVEGIRICVLRPQKEILYPKHYNPTEKKRDGLKSKEDESITLMKTILATDYSAFADNPPNLNFSLYTSSNITSSGKFEYYNDIALNTDKASTKPDPEYLALRRKFDEVAGYPERFPKFGVKNYHYESKVAG